MLRRLYTFPFADEAFAKATPGGHNAREVVLLLGCLGLLLVTSWRSQVSAAYGNLAAVTLSKGMIAPKTESFSLCEPRSEVITTAPGLEQSEKWLAAAITLNPGNPSNYRLQGLMHSWAGDAPLAIHTWNRFEALVGQDRIADLCLAQAYEAQGDHAQALDLWRRADAVAAFALRSAAWRKQGEFERSIADLTLAAEIEPGVVQRYYGLFAAGYGDWGDHLRRTGQAEKAVAAYQKALQIDPRYTGFRIELGRVLVSLGRYPEAKAELRRVVAAGTPWHRALANEELGKLFIRQGQWGDAIDAYRRAVELEPNLGAFRVGLAHAYDGVGAKDKAEGELITATQVGTPWHRALAYAALGDLRRKLGHPHDAVDAYQRAIALAPDQARFYASLGEAYTSMGEIELALQAYQDALSLRPDDETIRAAHDRLVRTINGQ